MATSFSGGGSRSTRREPPTLGKQLVNFINCGCTKTPHIFSVIPTQQWIGWSALIGQSKYPKINLESLVVLKLINSFKSTILTAKLWTLSSLILIFDNNKKRKNLVYFLQVILLFFLFTAASVLPEKYEVLCVFQVIKYKV